jgi:hypothetical protein
MLLEELGKIAKCGSEKPLFLWLKQFGEIAKELIGELEEIHTGLTDGTEVKKNVWFLIKLLKIKQPNELELAQSLSHVADLFRSDVPEKHKELINDYIRNVMKFINIAQASEFSRQSRQKLLGKLSPEQQKEYDKKLFGHEGMIFCLEYYLAIYKAMKDSKTEEEKRKYIESNEINLGFGNIPGLWVDFSRDEVLSKFIYAILDDKSRNHLTEAYFSTKSVIMKINMNCDKQNKCEVHYNEVTFQEVQEEFRSLILELLNTFLDAGIERLGSFFFKPYGDKPLIQEVLKQI